MIFQALLQDTIITNAETHCRLQDYDHKLSDRAQNLLNHRYLAPQILPLLLHHVPALIYIRLLQCLPESLRTAKLLASTPPIGLFFSVPPLGFHNSHSLCTPVLYAASPVKPLRFLRFFLSNTPAHLYFSGK